MKLIIVKLLLLCSVSICVAREDIVPEWMDTIAPVVDILPRKRFHNEMFHLTAGLNEPGRIFIGLNTKDSMELYEKPRTIIDPGNYTVYFYAEDDIGNVAPLDSMIYVLDKSSPDFSLHPKPGVFEKRVHVKILANEACTYYMHDGQELRHAKEIADTFFVTGHFEGYISARDSAGNVTTHGPVEYVVDTAATKVGVDPEPGVYNTSELSVRFDVTEGAKVFFSLDPTAPSKWFTEYRHPFPLPHGISLIRYYSQSRLGLESDIEKVTFVIDTIAPRIRHEYIRGKNVDTLHLFSSEPAQIRYALNAQAALGPTQVYRDAIPIIREGKGYVKAMARDSAGNMSELFVWEHRYDTIAPKVWPLRKSGTTNGPFALRFGASEKVNIFYTLDGSSVSEQSLLYSDSIPITRNGVTVIRYIGVDMAGNVSKEDSCRYELDAIPPTVRARVEENIGGKLFYLTLQASEPAKIYYESGENTPDTLSPVYSEPIALRAGQRIQYFARDSAGNNSKVYEMDELSSPQVTVFPPGGVYSRRVQVSFQTNTQSTVYWRVLPDTAFLSAKETLTLKSEGLHAVEYFSENQQGMKSTVRRNEYLLDWTAPQVNLTMRKGAGDSVIVFFDCDENATIYYTLDGSSPVFGKLTQVAGNKFLMSKDRITIKRSADTKLAFFAEDIAGNQSMLSVVDVAKPRVIPNLPADPGKVYDRIVSVQLNTFDENSQIYYECNGNSPSTESRLYTEPITLMKSDTIVAFVMDVSGYRGDPDTFVYNIDLPPAPLFSTAGDTVFAGKPVSVDASGTHDRESGEHELTYCWDFDSDGTVDVEKTGDATARHVFEKPGRFDIILWVKDPANNTKATTREILIIDKCPQGMVFVPAGENNSFCIDRYEWPNKKGMMPESQYSWVEARMKCHDEGKRLCTAKEWEYACSGGDQFVYPYGEEYEKGKCPDSGNKVQKSGEYQNCGEGFGLADMVGNVWEWVDTKQDSYPVMMGGTSNHAQKAHCKTKAVGHALETSEGIGFRCCR